MAIDPSQPNLLPDPRLFTQPMGIGDLLGLLKFQKGIEDDQAARAPKPSGAPPPSDGGMPTDQPVTPGPSFQGSGAPGQASPNYGQPKWSAQATAASPYDDIYAAKDKEYGFEPGTMKGFGYIESSHNPKARTGNSQYRGLMQIGYDEEKRYGTNVWDPASAIDTAAKIASRNRFEFRQAMGRDPTPGELYLMHQQGAGGGMALIRNPNMSAQQALQSVGVNPGLARKSISGNGGNPDAPASQFVQKWSQHPVFGGRTSAVAGPTRVASADTGTVSDAQKPWDRMTEEEKWAPKQPRSLEEQEAAQKVAASQPAAEKPAASAKSTTESGKIFDEYEKQEEPPKKAKEELPATESGKILSKYDEEPPKPSAGEASRYPPSNAGELRKQWNRGYDPVGDWAHKHPYEAAALGAAGLTLTGAGALGALPSFGALLSAGGTAAAHAGRGLAWSGGVGAGGWLLDQLLGHGRVSEETKKYVTESISEMMRQGHHP